QVKGAVPFSYTPSIQPPVTCALCQHRQLIGDGSEYECKAKGPNFTISTERDWARENNSTCDHFKPFERRQAAYAPLPPQQKMETPDPTQLTLGRIIDQLTRLGQAARKLLESELQCHTERTVSTNYDTGLVQVAASAISALEDNERYSPEQIWEKIKSERARQDATWGELPRYLDPLVWVVVMVEELAEVAEEVLA
ncbi:MAG: hypothetical protein WCA35_22770, partial [Kovacikia sp.]